MPTGYTAAIEDGISFRDFTLRCARAFGAYIHLRDEPMDAPLTPMDETWDVSRYEQDVAENKDLLEKLKAESNEEIQKRLDAQWNEDISYAKDSLEENIALRTNYENMLKEIEAWNPPQALLRLKEFMKEQVTNSLEWDCNSEYYEGILNRTKPSVEEWRKQEIELSENGLRYAEDRLTGARKQRAECRAFHEALIASLPEK